jgi:metal-sulfur cluster biosynthetic enzyme
MKKNKKSIVPTPPEQRTESYWEALNNIIDPEIGVGIIDLGLIYTVEIKKGIAEITMTFTSMGCPAGPSITEQIKEEMEKIPGVKKAKITIVWDPIWTADRMNPNIRFMLP